MGSSLPSCEFSGEGFNGVFAASAVARTAGDEVRDGFPEGGRELIADIDVRDGGGEVRGVCESLVAGPDT